MDISVITPFLDESESLPELADWIQRVAEANHYTYEIIMVDDGSSDGSWEVVQELRKKNPNI
jgi:glycosyltransferase involved in cell wall biosynthesis